MGALLDLTPRGASRRRRAPRRTASPATSRCSRGLLGVPHYSYACCGASPRRCRTSGDADRPRRAWREDCSGGRRRGAVRGGRSRLPAHTGLKRPRTSFNGHISPHRRGSRSASSRSTTVKAIKKRLRVHGQRRDRLTGRRRSAALAGGARGAPGPAVGGAYPGLGAHRGGPRHLRQPRGDDERAAVHERAGRRAATAIDA